MEWWANSLVFVLANIYGYLYWSSIKNSNFLETNYNYPYDNWNWSPTSCYFLLFNNAGVNSKCIALAKIDGYIVN